MLELQITAPTQDQHFPSIQWNHEELKHEIAEAVKDYQNLVVTPETEKDCKDTRARLNQLRVSLETARKEMKKKVNEPYEIFEREIREVEAPIDSAIENLDSQLKEIAEQRKIEKRKMIEAEWEGLPDKPKYLSLDKVWNDRWLNATFSMKKVLEDFASILATDKKNVEMLSKLPEYAYEALHYYTHTLNVTEAISKANEHAQMEKAKKEAEQRAQEMAKDQAQSKTLPEEPRNEVTKAPAQARTEEKTYTFRFEIQVTAGQAQALGNFCREHGIALKQLK